MTESPHPGTVLKLLHLAVISSIPRALLTKPTIALAKGCSEPFSAAAKMANNRLSGIVLFFPPDDSKPKYETDGFPCVMVPVLSKTTVVVLWALSKGSAPVEERKKKIRFSEQVLRKNAEYVSG